MDTSTTPKPKKPTWTPIRVRLGDIIGWEHNPRMSNKAQAKRLIESEKKWGQPMTFAVSPLKDGKVELYDGHQRYSAWLTVYGEDYEVDARQCDRFLHEEERLEFVVTMHAGATGSWDWQKLSSFPVPKLIEMGFDESLKKQYDFDALNLNEMLLSEGIGGDVSGVEKGKKPNPRHLPLDVIFTINGTGGFCCLAVRSGLLYGIQSGHTYCANISVWRDHNVSFIDNDYFKYDHKKHLECVEKYSPKYCTVRDVMTEDQCEAAGIAYYPLDQILSWAEELTKFSKNVIVIPKYDCIKDIPEKFMLGYSIPTSHGGAPLPVDLFRGRRIHLLGGSWGRQLDYLADLGEDVVSLDNNYIMKQAMYGSFVYPDGKNGSVSDILPQLISPLCVAMTISFSSVASKINELYGGSEKPAEETKQE